MSGILSIPFTFLALYIKGNDSFLWWCLAFLAFIVASYFTWKSTNDSLIIAENKIKEYETPKVSINFDEIEGQSASIIVTGLALISSVRLEVYCTDFKALKPGNSILHLQVMSPQSGFTLNGHEQQRFEALRWRADRGQWISVMLHTKLLNEKELRGDEFQVAFTAHGTGMPDTSLILICGIRDQKLYVHEAQEFR